MEKETIVLYPSTGPGHLTPMVLLAERLTGQGFSVPIVTMDPGRQPGFTNNPLLNVTSLNPSISFHALPAVSCPAAENKHRVVHKYETIRAYNPKVLEFLTLLSATRKICAMVVDFFHADAISVARELGIPVYVFMTSGASVLAIFLHLSYVPPEKSFKDMGDASLNLPGVPPIPTFDMPEALHNRESVMYECFVKNKRQLIEADGILVNTFQGLEPRAVAALKQGSCVPGHTMPPVYCIGPLVTGHGKQYEESRGSHDCLAWLDSQPKKSVVFLCFGSVGGFTPAQIKEIVIGLENSGHRFLWVVCSREDARNFYEPRRDPDLHSLLPEGFLSRTKDRGMVVRLWAPQNNVLNHQSVGGFVSHCGWNSALEAIIAGVPMICWPLYAEQGINKVLLVEEMKVGVAVKGHNKELVGADEIETTVRCLMKSEAGKTARKHMEAYQKKSLMAVARGGPSDREFETLLRDIGVDQKEMTAASRALT